MLRRRREQRPASGRLVLVITGLVLLVYLPLSASAFVVCPSSPRSARLNALSMEAKATATPSTNTKSSGGGGGQRKAAGAGAKKKKEAPAPASTPAGGKKGKALLGSGYAWALSESKALPAFTNLAAPLPAEQLLAFERKGHTVTRGLCSPEEMADWAKVVRAAFEKDKLLALRQKVLVLLGKEAHDHARTVEECEEMLEENVDPEFIPFLQTFNSWRRYQDVRRLALAPRFALVAAQLLGVSRVRLYQDSTFLKRDGDGPTLWHSDLVMAPFNTNGLVSMWMPMTAIPPEEEGGTGLCFASGSQRDFALSFWDDPHASNDLGARYPDVESYGRMEPGDASWHHGWCLHSSAENMTGRDRLAFTLAFVDADAPLLGTKAKNRPHEEDALSYEDWVRDFKPGERLRDHVYLPLVWDGELHRTGGRK